MKSVGEIPYKGEEGKLKICWSQEKQQSPIVMIYVIHFPQTPS